MKFESLPRCGIDAHCFNGPLESEQPLHPPRGGVVRDRCRRSVNLAREIIAGRIPRAWIVDLFQDKS